MSKPISKFNKSQTVDKVSEMAHASVPDTVKRPVASKEDKEVAIKRRPKLDAVTDALGEIGYHANRRFPFLVYDYHGRNYALDVHRYYDNNRLAIDICLPEDQRFLIEFKTKKFQENGIEYYHVISLDEMNKIIEARNGRGLH